MVYRIELLVVNHSTFVVFSYTKKGTNSYTHAFDLVEGESGFTKLRQNEQKVAAASKLVANTNECVH